VVGDGTPWMLIECKLTDTICEKSQLKMAEWLKPQHRVQWVDVPGCRKENQDSALRVTSYERFFAN
jgi:hypothetical protein